MVSSLSLYDRDGDRAEDRTKGRKGTSDLMTRTEFYKESKKLNTGCEGAKELSL